MAYPDSPVPEDEEQRLRELERLGLTGGEDLHYLDRIVQLASQVMDASTALLSLVGADRQHFLSKVGSDVTETSRSMAFCAHAIAGHDLFLVEDASRDERFANNPLVCGPPGIRFYAGVPVKTAKGHSLGTLCVLDSKPRSSPRDRLPMLITLAEMAARELRLLQEKQRCPLTGLLLRQPFFAAAEREFQRCRSQGYSLTMLLLGLDNFASINSRWGHTAGDHVLREFAALCRKEAGEPDLLGRCGDVSFALLILRLENQAMTMAESLRKACHRIDGVFSPSGHIPTLSGGLSSLQGSDQRFVDLYQRAEEALALAKANGRDQVARVHGAGTVHH